MRIPELFQQPRKIWQSVGSAFLNLRAIFGGGQNTGFELAATRAASKTYRTGSACTSFSVSYNNRPGRVNSGRNGRIRENFPLGVNVTMRRAVSCCDHRCLRVTPHIFRQLYFYVVCGTAIEANDLYNVLVSKRENLIYN